MINVAAMVGLIFLIALRPSKPAPTTRRAIGVAVLAIFVMALYGIAKAGPVISIPKSEKGSPATIPMIMGFFRTFKGIADLVDAILGFIIGAYGQNNHRENIIQGNCGNNHHWSHSRGTINIIDKGNPQNGGTAAGAALDKGSYHGFILHKNACKQPDAKKH